MEKNNNNLFESIPHDINALVDEDIDSKSSVSQFDY